MVLSISLLLLAYFSNYLLDADSKARCLLWNEAHVPLWTISSGLAWIGGKEQLHGSKLHLHLYKIFSHILGERMLVKCCAKGTPELTDLACHFRQIRKGSTMNIQTQGLLKTFKGQSSICHKGSHTSKTKNWLSGASTHTYTLTCICTRTRT